MKQILIWISAAFSVSCGVKGPPLPPLPTTPEHYEEARPRSEPSPIPSPSPQKGKQR